MLFQQTPAPKGAISPYCCQPLLGCYSSQQLQQGSHHFGANLRHIFPLPFQWREVLQLPEILMSKVHLVLASDTKGCVQSISTLHPENENYCSVVVLLGCHVGVQGLMLIARMSFEGNRGRTVVHERQGRWFDSSFLLVTLRGWDPIVYTVYADVLQQLIIARGSINYVIILYFWRKGELK